MENYRPDGPYVIQSGKRKGKSLEILMFQNYEFLQWWLKELNSKKPATKNRLHQHLEWLMKQGKNRETALLCPQCRRKYVHYFSSLGNDRYGYSIHSNFTCCGSQLCRTMLSNQAAGATPTFLPIRFSVILNYQRKFDQKMVVRLLRSAYKLPDRLTAKTAFEFFLK